MPFFLSKEAQAQLRAMLVRQLTLGAVGDTWRLVLHTGKVRCIHYCTVMHLYIYITIHAFLSYVIFYNNVVVQCVLMLFYPPFNLREFTEAIIKSHRDSLIHDVSAGAHKVGRVRGLSGGWR